MSNDRYNSPLSERYASKEMQYIFSPDMKFKTWRKLWIALAESEMELGLNITQEQIDELKANADDINYDDAKEREKLSTRYLRSRPFSFRFSICIEPEKTAATAFSTASQNLLYVV